MRVEVPEVTTTKARAHDVTAPGSGTHLHVLNHLASVRVAAHGITVLGPPFGPRADA